MFYIHKTHVFTDCSDENIKILTIIINNYAIIKKTPYIWYKDFINKFKLFKINLALNMKNTIQILLNKLKIISGGLHKAQI